jgi:hypothetical protein
VTDLLPLFQAAERSALGQAIQTSEWAFAVIESFHLLALAALGGAILLVDLRLLGLGLRDQPVAVLARAAQPVLVASALTLIVTGAALFASEAVKCYYSTPFLVKMSTLGPALVFTFTVRRRVTAGDEPSPRPSWHKLVALFSLASWFTVAAAGRWIGYSG